MPNTWDAPSASSELHLLAGKGRKVYQTPWLSECLELEDEDVSKLSDRFGCHTDHCSFSSKEREDEVNISLDCCYSYLPSRLVVVVVVIVVLLRSFNSKMVL